MANVLASNDEDDDDDDDDGGKSGEAPLLGWYSQSFPTIILKY
jgi:hypothetical protein